MPTAVGVLVIDDSEADCFATIDALKSSGFEVAWTRVASRDQLASALDSAWDVVLAECNVPDLDCATVFDAVGDKHRPMPVVFVSRTAGKESAPDLLRRGATDFVLKSD